MLFTKTPLLPTLPFFILVSNRFYAPDDPTTTLIPIRNLGLFTNEIRAILTLILQEECTPLYDKMNVLHASHDAYERASIYQ
jgi:hypothetical protein